MKLDSNPMQTDEAHYTEPMEILMVEADEGSNMEVDKGEQISIIDDSDVQAAYP